ncbi:hypothetical protein HNY73_003523 [Argiope bruennichi]|uniref:Uncharacterized protein n=1 Tax=Argiope bruennichi TaxID=94029 RepID=A0A8T0FMW6_ARGBR|nr:hypothetical protein HNY73_003523 [Argiope bruennichi]
MATLRQKESKIPLRVDSKLKNISKIPLRVETKPKILTNTEPELKRTSTVAKKKTVINPTNRNKTSTAEIPKKELKRVNLQIKNKAKENKFQPSDKISLKNEPSNRASKTITDEKQIKNSNCFSNVLKNRNKITTKKLPERPKPIKGKEEENPFEKKIPEINIESDDPFKISEEEKQNKNSNHPSQTNIEFVADERMKNFILSNRELTPSMLKSSSKIKTSMMDRPSLYNRFKLSVDPYKQALADIENYDLASERQRASEMHKNKLYGTPVQMERSSLYKGFKHPINPYKQALAEIKNSDLASERQRVSEMHKNRVHVSPLQNRNSLYKPLKCVGDPYQDALKSLAKLRVHRNIKSCKKKPEMTRISESSESSTLPTPECEENILVSPCSSPLKKVILDSPSKTDEVLENRQISDLCLPEKNKEQKETDCFINKMLNISTLTSSLKTDANNGKVVRDLSPTLDLKQKSDKKAATFNHEFKNSILKSMNPFLNLLRTSEVRQSLFSHQPECFFDKMNPKIFTPQPVSLYPRLRLSESISPEFLSRRTTDILSCAPINTPLVLKSLGKYELSPVCKKLEFKDSPKETNKEENDSRENSQTFYLQNILTQQKILDQLAHQECSILMHEATFPCEIRNYLQNPVAQILNDGDETHFVPVSLRRLS